jgi:hypothetical protein
MNSPVIKLILAGVGFGVMALFIPALSVLLFGLGFVMVALAFALNEIKKVL